ncbi:MAG: 2-amino-4-hydroxy-6-hydroxymethyldihydropteridine diphosphokinase [Bryobacterales bacterium]|nr:2-amino-4-hydroxy-6-hydroxymethyldihydropteridine diphosphokinase [Bryobacterales bacterium]
MTTVYLSLGSNLGSRDSNLKRAIQLLHGPELRVLRISPVYETAPVDMPDQPLFLNLVLQAETTLEPGELLARTQAVEQALGRKPAAPKGPRKIDIDILLHGTSIVDQADLRIPHPAMGQRRFVLEPLADLTPDLCHPADGRPFREMLAATLDQQARKTSFSTGFRPERRTDLPR